MQKDPFASKIDGYPTQTSHEQRQTETILREHYPQTAEDPKPFLQRNLHLQWLVRNFSQGFPARFVSQDASQPWLHFWTIQSCYTLGAALDPANKQRCIDTIMACQHPGGGFGGGPGQNRHLLPTYAAVSALACVGRPGPGGGWDQIDRKKLYDFFLSLKQPDGSFLVSDDSEVDVRGIYCLICVATLLNLLTPELISGTAEFIASLQTYEGGFASASQPFYSSAPPSPESLLADPRPPLGEAHGGYTYCALASWVLLQPFIEKQEKRPEINLKSLTRWLVYMQGTKAELGGFKGRTNKLVDACYSWWVAGCFPLLRALGVGVPRPYVDVPHLEETSWSDGGGDWSDVEDEPQDLFDRIGLQEYLLYAGQHPAGGLRDKPPKPADAYHTLYALSGLATAQHRISPSDSVREELLKNWKSTTSENDNDLDEMRKLTFVGARAWLEEPGGSLYAGAVADRVNAMHPIFNMTMTHAKEILSHFYGQL